MAFWTMRMHGRNQRVLEAQALGQQLLRGISPMAEGSGWFGMEFGNGTSGSVWNSAVEFQGNDGFGEKAQEESKHGFEDETVEEQESQRDENGIGHQGRDEAFVPGQGGQAKPPVLPYYV